MKWLVRHRVPAAMVALVISAVLALLVREPVFEGSLVREMSPDLPELVSARKIAAARDGRESSVIILSPADGATIQDVFEAIGSMQAALGIAIADVEFRSILAVRDQLFFFDLGPDSPVSELLIALRESPQYQFLVSPSLPMFVELVVTEELGLPEGGRIVDGRERADSPPGARHVASREPSHAFPRQHAGLDGSGGVGPLRHAQGAHQLHHCRPRQPRAGRPVSRSE